MPHTFKSYQSNGSCFNQPGCKYGYKDDSCGTCAPELGYGEDEDGNCNICIQNFFVKRIYTDGRPECQGMDTYHIRNNNEIVLIRLDFFDLQLAAYIHMMHSLIYLQKTQNED